MTATMTTTCSYCGEPRAEDQPHDSRRCSTIAIALSRGAYADNTAGECDEVSQHICELTTWLNARPKQRGTQQYVDRQVALDRWVAKAQRIASR